MKKIPKDLQELSERIKNLKQKRAAQSRKKKPITSWQYAFQVVSDFVSPVIVGLCLGYFLDKWFDTRVIFMLILAILGCIAGTLNVYRITQKDIKGSK